MYYILLKGFFVILDLFAAKFMKFSVNTETHCPVSIRNFLALSKKKKNVKTSVSIKL